MEIPQIYVASALGRARNGSDPLLEALVTLTKKYGKVSRERVSASMPRIRTTLGDHEPTRLASEAELDAWTRLTPAAQYEEEVRILRSSTYVVAECSLPSIQLGIIITYAADILKKPVLCVRSNMVGAPLREFPLIVGNPRLRHAEYAKVEDLKLTFDQFFRSSLATPLAG